MVKINKSLSGIWSEVSPEHGEFVDVVDFSWFPPPFQGEPPKVPKSKSMAKTKRLILVPLSLQCGNVVDACIFFSSYLHSCSMLVGITGKVSGNKRAHQHKIWGLVALGTTPGLSQGGQTQLAPGTNPGCPPTLHCGTSVRPRDQHRFVHGTNRGRKGGRKSLPFVSK